MSERRPRGLPRLPAPVAAARPPRPLHREGRDRRPGLALAGTAAALQRGPRRRGRAAGRRSRSSPRSRRRAGEQRSRPTCSAAGCWACCRHDPLYPPALRDAADAPWALIGRGDPALLDRAREPAGAVTVVGARRASSYGREVARELGRELAAAGLVVVSGLAFGIDACAHRGALEAGRDRRRARLRRRRRLPGRAPLALAADPRARPRPLRAAARDRAPGAGPSRPATGSWPRWPG